MKDAEQVPARWPLTPFQRRLWNRREKAALAQHTSFRLTPPAGTTTAGFVAALESVLESHIVLRSTVVLDPGGGPEQVYRPDLRFPIAVTDADDTLTGTAQCDQTRPFDLTAELPVRVAIGTSDGVVTACHLTIHHLAFDRASMWHLGREVIAGCSGTAPTLDVCFPLHALHIPCGPEADRNPTGGRAGTLGVVRRLLDQRSVRRIKALPGSPGVAFTALAAFVDALGEEWPAARVLVPVGTRPRGDAGVGPFVRVVEADLTGLPAGSLAERAAHLRRSLGHANARVRGGPPPSDDGAVPVGFNFTRRPRRVDDRTPDADLGDVWGAHAAEVAWRLDVEQGPDGWSVDLFFASELVSGTDAGRLLDRFEAVLPAVDATIVAAPLRPAHATLAPSFAADLLSRLAENGDDPAVVAAGATLSRRELRAWATDIALRLRATGIERGEVVGVCLRPGLATPAAFLGVLLAGGVYLPLDPRQPAARREAMLAAAGAQVLLADPAGSAPADTASRTVLVLDRPPAAADGAIAWRPVRVADPAYLIFTSGSTGLPKGVLVDHGNLTHLGRAFSDLLGDRRPRTVLLAAAPSFDAHIGELVAGLVTGAALVPPDTYDLDGVRAAYAQSDLATVVPSLLSVLAPSGGRPDILISVGERLDARLARELRPGGRLLNAYGPTEGTVCASVAELGDDSLTDPVPIGTPLTGVGLYVLAEDLHPVRTGSTGELYIGGAGVTRGYLDRRRETAAVFLPDPFQGTPGARMYRTGDRAVLRPDGQLVFMGRVDDQVKVDGHRVELGEVNAAVGAHPRVAASAVTAVRTGSGTRLSAYVVPTGDGLSADDLRSWLSALVPDYLVPSWVTMLEQLPVAPSGKVDRAALPVPVTASTGPSEHPTPEGVAPPRSRDDLAALLVTLWQHVLRSGPLDPTADVLRLGASSLDVARVVWRVRDAASGAAIKDVYDEPVIARHARRMWARPGTGAPARDDPDDGPVVASALQQQLFMMSARDRSDVRYNVPLLYRSTGELDLDRLRSAMVELCRLQPGLRSGLEERGGTIQVVEHPSCPPPELESVRLPTVPALSRWLDTWVRVPFDLTRPPLLRAAQVRGPDGWHLGFVVHHAIFDARSVTLFRRGLQTAYAGGDSGRPPPSFGAWLRHRDPPTDADLAFWTAALADVRPLTGKDLQPVPRPPAAIRDGVIRAELATGLGGPLDDLVRGTRGSVFAVLLTALQVVLSARTGRRVFATAVPVSLRRDPRWDDTIGCLVDAVHVRADVRGGRSVAAAVEAVRDVVIEVLEHSGTPLSSVLHALRRRGRPVPLSGVSIQVIDGSADWSLGDVHLTDVRPPSPGHRLDLQFQVAVHPDKLVADVIFDDARFDSRDIRSMIADLNEVLTTMLHDTDAPLRQALAAVPSRVSVLLPDDPSAPDPNRTDLAGLILAQAEKQPDRVAATDGTRTLTYGDLVRRARTLAQRLETAGVRPGDPVAVLTERSVDLVVALVGCLLSRAVYVPLDGRAPTARNEYVLRDSAAVALVVDRATHAGVVPVVSVDVPPAGSDRPAAQSAPQPPAAAADLAYVIYTSGTTGTPKGVAVERRNLANLVRAMTPFYDGPAPLRVGLMSPVSFDASWKSIACIGFGHELVIVGHEARRDADSLRRLLADGLDLLDATPHDLDTILTRPPATTLVGGEEIGSSRWRRTAEVGSFWNVYGPTEGTVFAAISRIDGDDENIGHPVAGTYLYVLDDSLRPVPVGTAGELFIGGAGVARGYVGRAVETAALFLPDPLSEQSGARMYRTGDRALLRPDGRMQFAGRLDDQVQVRGHRVEPAEVNAALTAHPDVGESAITAIRSDGVSRLSAYVVPAPGATLDGRDLRSWLTALLPDYMIPSWISVLPRLPLTPSGKVDRSALPAPAGRRSGPDGGDGADGDGLTRLFLELWQDVLEVTEARPEDNFFDLGGDSISAMQLAARAATAGVEVFSADVFEAQTVASLVRLVRERARTEPADATREAAR